jgi:DNA modification methylase
MPLFGNNNYLQSIEVALVLRKGQARLRFGKRGGQQPHNFIETPQVGGAERQKQLDDSAVNLAQKPLGITLQWVAQASKTGDWVLDAFAGTGTTTFAALSQGRNACAVEENRVMTVTLEEKRIKPFFPGARSWP